MCDEEKKILLGLGKHCRSERITAENCTTVYSRQKWDMHKSALITTHLPISEADTQVERMSGISPSFYGVKDILQESSEIE